MRKKTVARRITLRLLLLPWHCVHEHLNAPDLQTVKTYAFIQVNQVHFVSNILLLLNLLIHMETARVIPQFLTCILAEVLSNK